MKILLVEDDAILRRAMSLLLAKWCSDGQVDVAEDGETALEMMSDEQFDLVFLDEQLPDINGHEVAMRIRQQLRQKHPWVVGLSAHVADEERELFLGAGMNDALQKPLREASFKETLSKLTNNQSSLDG